MIFALSLLAALLLPQLSPSTETIRQELKRRLSDYESGNDRSAAALRPIAQLAVDAALSSTAFDVWVEGCASTYAPATASCDDRLRALVKKPGAPAAQRARAAAVLARVGRDTADKNDALSALSAILAKMTTSELVPVVGSLRLLPAKTAVPVLLRLLGSAPVGDKVAACRTLGHFDTVEVRDALQSVVAASGPGLQPWNTCMVARARLREPDSVLKLAGFSRALEGEDLLDAANAMLETGNDQGTFLLRRLTREATGVTQVRAAGYLAAHDAEAAGKLVDVKLADPQPAVRAEALVVERRLKRIPSSTVRARLVDSDALVQLRAGEAILEWAATAR